MDLGISEQDRRGGPPMAKTTEAKPAEYASLEEVEEAIGRLTPADSERLSKFAQLKVRGLLGLGFGVEAEDLLQEALTRSLQPGGKRWPKNISFVNHLIAAVRNIAGHLVRDGHGARLTSLDPPDASEADGDGVSHEWDRPTEIPGAERIAVARARLQKIEKRFENDDRVLLVMEGLATEMTGPEIKADLGITQNELETAMTRLRRGAAKVEEEP